MILDIAGLVARLGDLGPEATDVRVAFVKTTDPTFLLFTSTQAHPRYVAKIGDLAELRRREAIESRLYALMPDALARPFGLHPLASGRGMLLVDGLPGVPWFRLADRLRDPADWTRLRDRCAVQLRRFQAAVSSQPDWVVPATHFGGSLRELTARLADVLAPHGPAVGAAIDYAQAELDALGPVPATFQHGDFVLNNILVSDDRLSVLDLVDFGKWRVPLLDAFALACSVHVHASPHVAWHHLSEDLSACAAAAADGPGYTSRQRTAFFAYFLLTAISDTLGRPSRQTIRLTYLDHLRALGGDTRRYVRAFDAQV